MDRETVRTRDPERKPRIMTAAAELIGRNGFHAVSMTDIGAESGITGSGIYRHFDSKSAILVALFDEIIDSLIADQSALLEGGTDDAALLELLVNDQVSFAVGKRALAQVYYNEIQNLPEEDRGRLRRKQRMYVEEWVHLQREIRPELDDAQARALVHAAIGTIQSSLFHNVGLDEERTRSLLMRSAMAILRLDLSDDV